MDKILTLNDWWDGPLLGLTTFNNEICIFERIFSVIDDDYIDLYYLTPTENNDADMILNDWKIWCSEMSLNPSIETAVSLQKRNKVDLYIIAEQSPEYHKYIKQAVFYGKQPINFYSTIEDYYVKWK